MPEPRLDAKRVVALYDVATFGAYAIGTEALDGHSAQADSYRALLTCWTSTWVHARMKHLLLMTQQALFRGGAVIPTVGLLPSPAILSWALPPEIRARSGQAPDGDLSGVPVTLITLNRLGPHPPRNATGIFTMFA